MAKEKVSRRRLLKEPDEFITTTARIIGFARRHRRTAIFCLAGIVVIGLAFWGWNLREAKRNRRAQDAYAQAYQVYRNAETQSDPAVSKDMLSKAVDRFQEVIQQHSGTRSAWMALVYKGHACRALKRYEEAIQAYESALGRLPADELQTIVYQGLGHAWMAKGDLDKAIFYFQKLKEVGGKGFEQSAQWNIAHCYRLQGKKKEALEIYRELEKSFPNPLRRLMAKLQAERLAAEAP